MAEELTGLGAEASVVGSESPVSAPASTQTEAEKLIPQSQVNKLIGQNKNEAYQKGVAETLAKYNINADGNAQNGTQETVANQQQSAKSVEQVVREQLAQQNYAVQHQQAMASFVQKMDNGPKKYADFEEKVAPLNLPSMLPIVHLANAVDNSEDVVYELATNPEKIKDLYRELSENRPQLALMMVKKLSDSIKRNQAAANQPKPDEPLSQLKPSNVGMDNGSQSISALRRKDYLRG